VDNPAEDIQQPYDTLMKAFFRSEVGTLIPYVLKGATLDGTLEEAEQNVEIDRSMLKADLAYRIKYLLLQAILHIELQSGPDKTMARRMLAYFANLHLKYNVPVFCIVIFLFKCAVEQSPYRVSCGDKVMLPEFHYDVIRLWEVDPEPILNEHDVPLYVLLLGMKDPTADMLRQAIREIREFYEPQQAVEHLAYFTLVLYGTTTVSNEVKDTIEKELAMSSQYVDFMTQNPLFERMLQEREARGKIEMILQLLRIQFSDTLAELVELALRRVDIRNAEVIGPLEEATTHLDKQGIDRWVKEHLPAE
jgi:hypothetical protein